MTRTQITIQDREFTVYDHGRSDGPAIVYHHGTPASGEPLDQLLAASPEQLREMVSTLVVGPDSAVMQGPVGEYWASAMPQAFKHGVQGWVDDDLAFAEPFGFELSDIRVPTLIVHGRQDSFVPVAHGEWLAREMPNAESWILEDEAHLSLLANRMPDVFDWLLAQA